MQVGKIYARRKITKGQGRNLSTRDAVTPLLSFSHELSFSLGRSYRKEAIHMHTNCIAAP